MAEKIEISLTDFIGFVNKMGSAKLSHVRKIKDRPEYEHYMDFYKPIREAILKLHKNYEGKEVLDTLLSHLSDDKKKNNYPALINGYKKFLGRKKFEWVKPPKKDWKVGDVIITVNPELGLEEKKKDGKICQKCQKGSKVITFYVIDFQKTLIPIRLSMKLVKKRDLKSYHWHYRPFR
jgi:hypothetical protein